MQPHYADDAVTLYHGDCLDVLSELPDASVDAVVTDPPYGLEFMGRAWDAPWQEADINADAGFHGGGVSATRNAPSFTGSTNPKCLKCKGTRRGRRDGTAKVAVCLCGDGGQFPNHRAVEMRAFQTWCEQWATECLRVLKPGGHMLAFGGTRTWHRLACAIEDAGFEIRDSIAWLYGSGFPKSLDVSKAIDKAAGAEREVVGANPLAAKQTGQKATVALSGDREPNLVITAPATPDAQKWQGWGTALKPAHEPIVVARKPLVGTVAANVLAHGTGALNVDGCRIGTDGGMTRHTASDGDDRGQWAGNTSTGEVTLHGGRWPANVVLDPAAAAELDRQSGMLTSGVLAEHHQRAPKDAGILGAFDSVEGQRGYGDTGGASRFFYVAKAGSSERPRVELPADEERLGGQTTTRCVKCGKQRVNVEGSYCVCAEPEFVRERQTHVAHPTVKPLDLMRWLVRLVTPPGGVVLEPFAGSGTTAEACIVEGFRCIAIEREADYLPLILQRITKPIEPVMF